MGLYFPWIIIYSQAYILRFCSFVFLKRINEVSGQFNTWVILYKVVVKFVSILLQWKIVFFQHLLHYIIILEPSLYQQRNLYMIINSRVGSTHHRIHDLYICTPNIILDLFRLLVIPYTWLESLSSLIPLFLFITR